MSISKCFTFRCRLPTCSVCSRTCEGVHAVNIDPPPSQKMTISPPVTPRRKPLNVTTTENVNVYTSPHGRAKLLKREFDDEDAQDSESEEDDRDKGAENTGCGKTFCRNCCTEDPIRYVAFLLSVAIDSDTVDSHLTSCFDCQTSL